MSLCLALSCLLTVCLMICDIISVRLTFLGGAVAEHEAQVDPMHLLKRDGHLRHTHTHIHTHN